MNRSSHHFGGKIHDGFVGLPKLVDEAGPEVGTVLQIVENQRNVRGVLAKEIRGEIGWLRSPRLRAPPEIPFPKQLDLRVLVPEVRYLRVLVGVSPLRNN